VEGEIEMNVNDTWLKGIVVIIMVVCVGFALACATYTPPTYKKIPMVEDRYSFPGFDIPERKPAASVPLTIAVVEPYYKDRVSAEYSKAIKSFSSHVGATLDEMLVAKGVTTKGPYGSLDELPFPDKKGSSLTLTQTVFIYISEKAVDRGYDYYETPSGTAMYLEVETYQMSVEFWINFEMREPLSAEKMWIKKLDLGVLSEYYRTGYNTRYDPNVGYVRGKAVFSTKTRAFADILNQTYQTVIRTAWTYLNTDEMLSLNEKVKEIRELKRY
jgi:hypothetical protein